MKHTRFVLLILGIVAVSFLEAFALVKGIDHGSHYAAITGICVMVGLYFKARNSNPPTPPSS